MSALPLAPLPVLPRPRPRLRLVGPGYVPQPVLPSEPTHRPDPQLLVPVPVERPSALPPARPTPTQTRSSGRPAVAAPVARGNAPTAMVAAPIRLTARGRLALRLGTFLLALGAATGLGAAAGALVDSGLEASGASVVVAQGESLWTVASAVAGPGEDVRDVAAQIAELNGLTAGAVSAGQILELPR